MPAIAGNWDRIDVALAVVHDSKEGPLPYQWSCLSLPAFTAARTGLGSKAVSKAYSFALPLPI